jgi:aminoglycoside phosphotransferase (APT) family kinase protein
MHSISKTPIDIGMAGAITADAFGAQARIRAFHELTDGFFNAAYAIDLADGMRCVLKVAPPESVTVLRYERDIMYAEVEVMRLVRRRTSMPVPEVYHFDTSRRLLGSPFMLMEFLPGTPLDKLRPSLSPDQRRSIDRETGAYLRQMNEIAGPSFGYSAPSAARHQSWDAAFLSMLDGVLADGEAMRVALPLPYAELRRRAARHVADLAEVSTPQLLHWDLWDGNIFVDPATGRISGVIDFERALWGDPLMEFQFRTLAEPPGFSEGYGRTMLDTPSQQRRRVLYNLYLYLIMIVECSYRQYATQDQERWAREQLDQELARLDLQDNTATA